MTCLLHPSYFPSIIDFVTILKADNVCFEVFDNYQKQTYRNRTEIYGANGKLVLTIPVNYTQKNRQLYKDVKIDNTSSWQKQHLKSLYSAYSMSPFFEFYIDDLMPFFSTNYTYILDANLACLDVLLDILNLELYYAKTTHFEKTPVSTNDNRFLIKKNKTTPSLLPYSQVFSEKHGFINNLSVLDVIFNKGTETEIYLKKNSLI